MPTLPEAVRDNFLRAFEAFERAYDLARDNEDVMEALEMTCKAGTESLEANCGEDAP